MTDSPNDATPISWRAVTYLTPVVAAGGEAVGVVSEILGSDAEDIFHGVRVRLTTDSRDVLLSANLVTALTTAGVETNLTPAAFETLPTYSDEATYHLVSVGWRHKHPGWARDSTKDEEPG
jgi:hypothetical protein